MTHTHPKEIIFPLISQYGNIPIEEILPDMTFGEDIIIDSIELWEIFMQLKQYYSHIDQKRLFTTRTVWDLINICNSK